MTTFHSLHALLSARIREASNASIRFEITDDWLQGRTCYGGLIATCAAQAMRDVAGAGWGAEVRLRSLQTNFIGPVETGAMSVDVQVLREGKSLRQVQASVHQHGQTAALVLGVYGGGRPTVVPRLAPVRPEVATTPEQTPRSQLWNGVAPSYTKHLDLRWAEGGLPFSGRPDQATFSRIHMQVQGEPEGTAIDPELLTVLLADVPPTPALNALAGPAPASSVSWALELQPLDAIPAPDGWWRVDTDVHACAEAYVSQTTRLWSPTGALAALGHQVVTVYG